jgi:hypothetical protein
MILSGTGLQTGDDGTPLRRIDLRQPLGRRLLSGPYFDEIPLTHGEQHRSLAGTSVGYLLLHAPGGARTRLTITAEAGTQLQVTLIRLPREMGRLSLRIEPAKQPGYIRLRLTAHGSTVILEQAAWELRFPKTEDDENTSYRNGSSAQDAVRAWFGKAALKPGETHTSESILLPAECGAGQPVVFKVVGRDAGGFRVSAWAVVDAIHGIPSTRAAPLR